MLSKKNLVLLGAPGAGKGTISELLIEKYPLAHISTGDILRAEIARSSDLGLKAAKLMNEGQLVPDDIVTQMVHDRLQKHDCDNGFILDGFPRTIKQAELLEEALEDVGRELDDVIFMDIPESLLLQRLTARQMCSKCGAIYNKLFAPPKVKDVCDKCGGSLYQRPDDSIETAKERLEVFSKNTKPLIDFYKKNNLLLTIKETEKVKLLAVLEKELT